MKRREFVERVGIGAVGLASVRGSSAAPVRHDGKHQVGSHEHKPLDGPLATASVTFGAWQTDPPLNRFPNSSPAARNHHQQLPNFVTIKAGGTVTFIIAGLHQIVVYAPGTQPEDVNADVTTPTTGTPAGVPLINDSNNRVYFGPDPSLLPRDRVEAVHFPNPGLYLVICGVQSHFVNDAMFGFVRALPSDD